MGIFKRGGGKGDWGYLRGWEGRGGRWIGDLGVGGG